MDDDESNKQYQLNFGDEDITINLDCMSSGSLDLSSSLDIGDIISIDNSILPTLSASNIPYTTSGSSGYSFNNHSNIYTSIDIPEPTVNITNTGINIGDEGDINIGGKSLKTFMEKLEERFAILQPDPEKLENFEALKQAYEHYKLLEGLCSGKVPKDPNDGS